MNENTALTVGVVALVGAGLVVFVLKQAERQQSQTFHLFGELLHRQQVSGAPAVKKSAGEVIGGIVEKGVKLFSSIF